MELQPIGLENAKVIQPEEELTSKRSLRRATDWTSAGMCREGAPPQIFFASPAAKFLITDGL